MKKKKLVKVPLWSFIGEIDNHTFYEHREKILYMRYKDVSVIMRVVFGYYDEDFDKWDGFVNIGVEDISIKTLEKITAGEIEDIVFLSYPNIIEKEKYKKQFLGLFEFFIDNWEKIRDEIIKDFLNYDVFLIKVGKDRIRYSQKKVESAPIYLMNKQKIMEWYFVDEEVK